MRKCYWETAEILLDGSKMAYKAAFDISEKYCNAISVQMERILKVISIENCKIQMFNKTKIQSMNFFIYLA